jgi:hypothetical protein
MWELMDPNLEFFVFVILLDIIPSQPHCVQNYPIRYLSRDAHGFWDTLHNRFLLLPQDPGPGPNFWPYWLSLYAPEY